MINIGLRLGRNWLAGSACLSNDGRLRFPCASPEVIADTQITVNKPTQAQLRPSILDTTLSKDSVRVCVPYPPRFDTRPELSLTAKLHTLLSQVIPNANDLGRTISPNRLWSVSVVLCGNSVGRCTSLRGRLRGCLRARWYLRY